MNNSNQRESSNHGFFPKVFKRFSSNSERLTTCPHCGIRLTETAMMEHLKQCENLSRVVRAPDGTITSMDFVGADQAHDLASRPVPDNSILYAHHDQSFQQRMVTPRSEQRKYQAPNIIPPVPPAPPADSMGLNSQHRQLYNVVNDRPGYCRFCGNLSEGTSMIQHAQKCQVVNYTFQSANGSMGSVYYAGTNQNLGGKLSEHARYYNGNQRETD